MMEVLYKKKVIRDFLSLYNDTFWTQLVSHVLEYGIILFKKKHNVSALSPEDICLLVEKFKKEEKVYDSKVQAREFSKKKRGSGSRSNNKMIRSRSGSVNSEKNDMSFSGKASTLGNSSRGDNNKGKNKRIDSVNKDKRSTSKAKAQTPKKDKGMFKFAGNSFKSRTDNNNKKTVTKTHSNSKITMVSNYSSNHLNTTESHKDKEKDKEKIMRLTASNKKSFGNTTLHPPQQIPKDKGRENSSSKNNQMLKPITTNINTKKLINFDSNSNKENNEGTKSKPKPESRIKSLIENDKKKFQEMKHVSQVPNDKFPTAQDQDQDITIKTKNQSSIISLEEKLNGLTQKLCKVDSTIASYNTSFPYLSQHKDTNENNDEDYLGEDQIDLNHNNQDDEIEMRYYRKMDLDE